MFVFSWGSAGGFIAVGVIAGLMTYDYWIKSKDRRRRRFPNRWPLDSRRLLTTNENQVWQWLKRAFYDYDIMVKTPLQRFTRPRNKKEGQACAELLGNIYSTFTVCTADGTVIGCLDVPGKAGLLRSHRDMKESILTACGIAYAVVRANDLPGLETIRAAFLGEIDLDTIEAQHAPEEVLTCEFAQEVRTFAELSKPAPLLVAQMSLQSKLEQARKGRATDLNPLSTHTGIVDDMTGDGFKLAESWEDSFLSPLDSRAAALR